MTLLDFILIVFIITILLLKANFLQSYFGDTRILEDNDTLSDSYISLIQFLEINLLLHYSILYLVIIIVFYYIKSNYKISNLESILTKNLFNTNFIFFNTYSKLNKIWLIIMWTLLFISTITSVFFSYFILQNIELIGQIVVDK